MPDGVVNMVEIFIMHSIFIILMGYFTNPFRIKMYLLSLLGLESWMIVKFIVSTESQIQTTGTAINEPVWIWVIVLIYFILLYGFGMWLASKDKGD